jgi:hypothetical protein
MMRRSPSVAEARRASDEELAQAIGNATIVADAG